MRKRPARPIYDKENGCARCWCLYPLDENRHCDHCAVVVKVVRTPEKDAAFDRILMGREGEEC